jgi:serine/threonine protein kinase
MSPRTTSAEMRAVRVPRWSGPLVRGEVIGDTYRIDGILGSGGMSVVYLAHDVRLDREVAIKVVRDGVWSHVLRREGQAIAAVRHPGVIGVHGMGTHLGHDYLVLERLRGRTLQARMDTQKLPVPIDEAVDIGIAVCDALSATHRAGLAHRDLKPDNVFVCGARVVLIDFGLFVPECDVAALDQVAGAPEFMAPEVISRSVVPGAGPLVDLYALGIMLFELLIGRTPFNGEQDVVLRRHLSESPPDVAAIRPEVPSALAMLIGSLLEKSPLDRLGSAEAALWQLCAIRGRATGTGIRPFRVLVVDDDADVGTVLRRSLKQALPQLIVEVESDPQQALADIERACPDLVLMDLRMPEMNGVELMMRLSALPASRRPRVIGMSAEARDQDVAVLRTLGVVEFVSKDAAFIPRVSEVVGELRHR